MNPNREEALVALALTKRPAERLELLNRECRDDLALRQRLEALLASPSAAGPRSDELHKTSTQSQGRTELGPPGQEALLPTVKLDFADPPDEAVGQTLGRTSANQPGT